MIEEKLMEMCKAHMGKIESELIGFVIEGYDYAHYYEETQMYDPESPISFSFALFPSDDKEPPQRAGNRTYRYTCDLRDVTLRDVAETERGLQR